MKLFHNIKVSILSWLLHHGNQLGKDQFFYKVKNQLLAKYGKHICYEVQFIEGKKCWSCEGTGKFRCGWKLPQTCWSCGGTGWYRPKHWNILALLSFGKYEFHQPFMRVFEDPQSKCKTFTGYVERHPTKFSRIAAFILLLVFEKGYLKRYYRESGIGWRSYWWLPRNWIYNLIHIIKHGRRSIPFRYKGIIRRKISRLFPQKPKPVFYPELNDEDELPF